MTSHHGAELESPLEEPEGALTTCCAVAATVAVVLAATVLHWCWPAVVGAEAIVAGGVLGLIATGWAGTVWALGLRRSHVSARADLTRTIAGLTGWEASYRWVAITLATSVLVVGGAFASQYLSDRRDLLHADQRATATVVRLQYVSGTKGPNYLWVEAQWTAENGSAQTSFFHLSPDAPIQKGDKIGLHYRSDPPRYPAFVDGYTSGVSSAPLIGGTALGLLAASFIAWNCWMLRRRK